MLAQYEPEVRPTVLGPRSGFRAKDLLLAAFFVVLLCIQIAHHVLWRDEINAFAITWVSSTISRLFHYVHYEAHPWLWYFLLWIVTRFSVSVVALKVVQACIGAAIILAIALLSPFRTWEKALILSGYFFIYEYTVLARMYGLVVFFLVLYCWRRVQRPSSPILSAVLLGLMASSDTFGLLLSFALIVEYAYSAYVQRDPRIAVSPRRAVQALGVYAVLAGTAVWSARPAPDISWRTTGRIFSHSRDLSYLYGAFLRYAVQPFVPIKSPRTGYFWNPQLGRGGVSYFLLMLFILSVMYLALRGHRNLILMVVSIILAGTAFGDIVYMGSIRHYGFVFLAFFAAMWILRGYAPSAPLPKFAYGLLGLSALCGLWAVIASFRHPFSYDKAAASWILQNHLNQMPLVGEEDTSVIDIAEYLHRPIYMIECGCEDRVLFFSDRRDHYTSADAPQRILGAAHFYRDQPLLFVIIHPMHMDEQAALEREGFRIQPLAQFSGAEEIAENFYFYRLDLVPSASYAIGNMPSRSVETSKGVPHA